MTKKQIAMNAIGKVQNTDCKIPFKFTTESFWSDINDDEIPLELMGFFLSKEFAKNFWPSNKLVCRLTGTEFNFEDKYKNTCNCIAIFESGDCESLISPFCYHLQQMVVAEDPILYLKDYL